MAEKRLLVAVLLCFAVFPTMSHDIGLVIGPFGNEETTLRMNNQFLPFPSEFDSVLASGTGPIGGVYFQTRAPDSHLGAYMDVLLSRINLEFYDELNDEYVSYRTRILSSHGELTFFPIPGGNVFDIYVGAGATVMFLSAPQAVFEADEDPEWSEYLTLVSLPHTSFGVVVNVERVAIGFRFVRKMLDFGLLQPSAEFSATIGYRLP
ncbi:MAG: hypothetical protein EA383_06330 [Spirochaetaceae bacterium]|nr:MAG: hypothetical protein EA383_06330 [Spirochaetaceae bacterium]